MRVCLAADVLFYTEGGGHAWAYLNWALALRRAGCDVVWLESAREYEGPGLADTVERLRRLLLPYGFDDGLVLDTAGPLPDDCAAKPLEAATEADLLVDLSYLPPEVVSSFRRRVMVDIDPGFTQLWWSGGGLEIGSYDVYFTVGESVASGRAIVPDCGVRWQHLPPCVDLAAWPDCPPAMSGAPWTTVTHWWGRWQTVGDEEVDASKRAGFEPLLDLPSRVGAPLELTLGGLDDDEERRSLEQHGWRVRDAAAIAATPEAYRRYIQGSRGEFTAAKPIYVRLASGWLSDRTVCYLASGRPAIIEDTGGLTDGDGLLTFTTPDDAVRKLEEVERDYEHHCHAARELAQERFSGTLLATRLLEAAVA